jgi:hypothetical protein
MTLMKGPIDLSILSEEPKDMINNPSHYTSGKYEHADVVLDQGWDYFLGNCTKYLWRVGKKDPNKIVEDLEKARWYLNRKIQLVKWPTLTSKQANKVEKLVSEGMTNTDAITKVLMEKP